MEKFSNMGVDGMAKGGLADLPVQHLLGALIRILIKEYISKR